MCVRVCASVCECESKEVRGVEPGSIERQSAVCVEGAVPTRDMLKSESMNFTSFVDNNYYVETCSGSEEGACFRLIVFCISQL